MSLRSSGLRAEPGRASSLRVLSGHKARRSPSPSFSPEGACGTLDGSPHPRRHVLSNAAHGSVHLEQMHGGVCPRGTHDPLGRNTRGIAEDAGNRLRSARDGLCGLLRVPEGAVSPALVPFVQANCPDMHLGRPPVAPVVSPRIVFDDLATFERTRGPGLVAATATRSTT